MSSDSWLGSENAVFALVDGNNFYASCEQVFQPALRERPLVVLSNNDGCAIARCAQCVHASVAGVEEQGAVDEHIAWLQSAPRKDWVVGGLARVVARAGAIGVRNWSACDHHLNATGRGPAVGELSAGPYMLSPGTCAAAGVVVILRAPLNDGFDVYVGVDARDVPNLVQALSPYAQFRGSSQLRR